MTKENIEIKKTERGWLGHYCRADKCIFRRNTLLECDDIKIIISTVGNITGDIQKICDDRYYETLAFYSCLSPPYTDIDISKQIYFASPWQIKKLEPASDNHANEMHENVVTEITENIKSGIY